MENKIKTQIIAGFTGVGKSALAHGFRDIGISDLEADQLTEDISFDNYIHHIKSLIGIKRVILIPAHPSVLKSLENEGIKYTLVYPDHKLKFYWLARLEHKGYSPTKLQYLNKYWDNHMHDLENANPEHRIILQREQYLSDVLHF